MRLGSLVLALAVALPSLGGCEGCDNPPKVTPLPDVSAPPPPPPPPRPGCARVGAMGGVEGDPSCLVAAADLVGRTGRAGAATTEDAMREAMKHVETTVAFEPPEVLSGGQSNLAITLRNASASEIDLYLEGETRLPGPRTDWSRVVGIPEQREPLDKTPDRPHLFVPMTTVDHWNRDVDQVPIVAGSTPVTGPTSVFLVHLRAGGKLTHTASWWALRIPAPAPIFKDDAGHRWVPKTQAFALLPGDYNVVVELPLYALTREERKFSAAIKVLKPTKESADGGAH